MLNPRLKERLAQGYSKIGDIGFKIALNLRIGKDYTHRQKEMYVQGIILRTYLRKLFRHVSFTEDNIPIVTGVTEEQVNKWIDVVVKVGELDKYPIAPTLLPKIKPIVLLKGAKGDEGDAGQNGSDATIVVAPDTGEDTIAIREEVVDGVKTFFLSLSPYTNPALVVSIQGGKVFEIGTVQNFNLAITTTKGKNQITALTMLNPSALDSSLQAIVNLATLNGLSQPVVLVLAVANLTTNQTYQVRISDGVNQVDAQDTMSFVYPFLTGNNDNASFDRYSLVKTIAVKSDREFTLNGTDDYFFICYPAEYGLLESIKDQNGFDVTTSWQVVEESVTSNSLATNWTVNYKVYRTIDKTTINNRKFSIKFP